MAEVRPREKALPIAHYALPIDLQGKDVERAPSLQDNVEWAMGCGQCIFSRLGNYAHMVVAFIFKDHQLMKLYEALMDYSRFYRVHRRRHAIDR
ncbi:MAG TPA: hypothetical protein VJ810_30345 [Blastocatellia bacterium]|nr:hypothetical protein [Blastocatellia bacterium]